MFQRIVAVVLLFSMALFEFGCYTMKPYAVKDVKPEWEISQVVTKDSSVVTFDGDEPGLITDSTVAGGVRNDFMEVSHRSIPLDSVRTVGVRQLDTSTPMLAVAAVGVGLVTFWLSKFWASIAAKVDAALMVTPTRAVAMVELLAAAEAHSKHPTRWVGILSL